MTSLIYMCFTNLFLSLAVSPLDGEYSAPERAPRPDELSSETGGIEQRFPLSSMPCKVNFSICEASIEETL